MRFLHAVTLVCSFNLAGCQLFLGEGLEGDWEGVIHCADGDLDEWIEIDHEGGDTYAGEVEMFASSTDGTYTLTLEISSDIEIDLDGAGEQELDYEVWLDDARCAFYEGNQLLSSSCEEIGIEVTEGWATLGELEWDGDDTIEQDDGDCSGELERD